MLCKKFSYLNIRRLEFGDSLTQWFHGRIFWEHAKTPSFSAKFFFRPSQLGSGKEVTERK